MIGDDDGINPDIILATEWARSNDVDAIVGNLAANYRWAGTGAPDTFFTKMTDNTLVLSHFTGDITYVNVEDSLKRFAKAGCTYYLDFFLPKLYHGVIRRDRLDDLRSLNGAYIRGLSADIYLSVALACVVRKLVFVDYPLTIPGVCAESSSIVEGQIKKHSQRLEDAPHFRSNPGYIWSEKVPPIYCVEAIWTDSALHALRDMSRQDLLRQFNRYRMYANIVNANRGSTAQCFDHMKSHNLTKLIDILKLVHAFIAGPVARFLRKRLLSRFLIIFGFYRLKEFHELSNIVTATDSLIQYLNKNDMILKIIPFKNKITKK
jgi:hypothetical protein